jgi:hypothetical protein
MAKIKYFKIDTSNLKEDELDAIEILKEVAKEIHKIWEQQVNPTTGKISLYDEGITREEVIQASETDSDILSPYTVVRRGDDGSLYAVPYTEEYKEDIKKIILLLKGVEQVSKDFGFKKYIRNIYKAWEKGDFETSLVEYLKNDNNKIGILMGPIETYADKLLGSKRAFQFNLRIRRDAETDEVINMMKIVKEFSILKPYLSIAREMGDDKIYIRVDDVLIFAGRQAGSMSVSTNLPNDSQSVKKYGTRVVVYKNALDLNFETRYAPFLPFLTGMKFKFEKKDLKKAASRIVVLHEISEGLIKFPDASARLKGNIDAIRELNASIIGAKSASYHLLKGLINEKEYYEIVIMLIILSLERLARMKTDTSAYEYARGFAVVLNYLESKKALAVSRGKIKMNLEKMSQYVDALASVILSIFHESKYEEAQKLFDTYGSFDIVKRIPKI